MKNIVCFFILLGISVGCVAQTDTIAGKTHQLREVTISKDRHQRALQSTAPMHMLDRRDMQTMGVSDMADALHRLPGITLRDYGGAGGMKTVSVRGFGAKHTGVSYDGVMLSECQSGEIDLSRYSLDNVDFLSLTVGDNSDIFIPARNATTPATLTIHTLRQPSDDLQPHLTTQIKAGSFGYVSPFVRYEQCLSPTFSLSAVGEYVYAENDYPYTIKNGVETINDHRNNTRMNSGHAELNFLWNTGSTSQLGGKVYYYDNDRQLPGQVYYYSNTSRESLRDRNFFAQMTFQKRWGERLSLKCLAKYNWAASLYDDGVVAGWVQDGDYFQREAYTSFSLLYVPHNHWSFDYSIDYAYNNLNSTLPTDTRPYRNTLLQSATAKYHTGRLTVMGRLLYSLYLNAALDGEGANDMRRLSPSLSLSYALIPQLHLRASYKDIFRAPTFNESYFFHYGSKDLKAEDTQQLNIGVTYDGKFLPHTELTATADLYYNKVTDMIQGVPHNMFVWSCVNLGKVEVLGLDVTMRLVQRLGRHTLTATANYSKQQAHDHTNSESPYYDYQIAYLPLHSGAGSLGWENPWANLVLSGYTISERWSTNEHQNSTHIDGYSELSATIWRQFHIGKPAVELRLDLKNLLNKQYEIVRNYPMPGRCWQFTCNIKF